MALAGVGINTVSGFTASIKYALQASVEAAAKEAQRLSTGNKIINAYEDAAGLVIGTGLEGEARTLKVVLRGILQGQSALYIAEGAVASLTQISVRQKELTAAALSGVTSDRERSFINLEFNQLNQEVDRIATTTNFNGVKLIDGSISTGGNVITNTTNLEGGAGTSKLVYAASVAPTANISTLNVNGVSFRYGTGVTTGAIDVRQSNDLRIGFRDINSATAGIFTLNIQAPGTADITVNIVASGTPSNSAANTINIEAGTASQIAQRLAEQINTNADTIGFHKMANVSARADGGSVVIQSGKVFMDNSVTDATYAVVTTATATGTLFSSFQVGSNPANTIDTSTAAAITTTVTDFADGKAVALAAADQNALVTGIANQINGGAGAVTLDNYSQTILNRLSATAKTDTTTPANAALTLQSKDKSLNGRIILESYIDNAGTFVRSSDVGVYSSGTKVGSLGISNVSIGGSLLGTGAGYLQSLQFAKSTTGVQTLSANTQAALVQDGAVFRIGRDNGGSIDFVMRQNPVFPNEVQIIGDPNKGTDDWKATLVNLVDKLRQSDDAFVKNLAYELDISGGLTISSKVADNNLNGLTFNFLTSNAATTATQTMRMAGGVSGGLNMANVAGAPGFEGGINRSNVSALYESSNKITLNVTDPSGNITYSAKGVDVSAGGNVRLVSNKQDQGGTFDLQLTGGLTITNQDQADLFAATLGDALAGLTFYQTRRIDSFQPEVSASTLNQAFAEITTKTYDGTVNVREVSVVGTTSDALGLNRSYITLKTDDGRIFQNIFNPGETLQYISKGQKVTLVSVDANGNPLDKNEKVELYFGGSDIDMTNNQSVAALQSDLTDAFKAGQAPMKFQADTNVSVVIPISLDALDIKALYKGKVYDVSTADNATEAGMAVDTAITALLAERDKIGSYESRFNYTIQSLQSYVQNMDAARSAFLDASMPDSVEGFSKENMKTQTAISVLKQIIQTQQQLVSLVQ